MRFCCTFITTHNSSCTTNTTHNATGKSMKPLQQDWINCQMHDVIRTFWKDRAGKINNATKPKKLNVATSNINIAQNLQQLVTPGILEGLSQILFSLISRIILRVAITLFKFIFRAIRYQKQTEVIFHFSQKSVLQNPPNF